MHNSGSAKNIFSDLLRSEGAVGFLNNLIPVVIKLNQNNNCNNNIFSFVDTEEQYFVTQCIEKDPNVEKVIEVRRAILSGNSTPEVKIHNLLRLIDAARKEKLSSFVPKLWKDAYKIAKASNHPKTGYIKNQLNFHEGNLENIADNHEFMEKMVKNYKRRMKLQKSYIIADSMRETLRSKIYQYYKKKPKLPEKSSPAYRAAVNSFCNRTQRHKEGETDQEKVGVTIVTL